MFNTPKLKLFSILLYFCLIFSLFSPRKIFAQTIFFSDDFGDGNANGWDTVGAPGWVVLNGRYGIDSYLGLTNSVPSDSNWNYGWTNISYDVDLVAIEGEDKNILIKFQD